MDVQEVHVSQQFFQLPANKFVFNEKFSLQCCLVEAVFSYICFLRGSTDSQLAPSKSHISMDSCTGQLVQVCSQGPGQNKDSQNHPSCLGLFSTQVDVVLKEVVEQDETVLTLGNLKGIERSSAFLTW